MPSLSITQPEHTAVGLVTRAQATPPASQCPCCRGAGFGRGDGAEVRQAGQPAQRAVCWVSVSMAEAGALGWETGSCQSGEGAGLRQTDRCPSPAPWAQVHRSGTEVPFSAQVAVPVAAETTPLPRETEGGAERAHRLPGEQQPRRQQEADPLQVGRRRAWRGGEGLALSGRVLLRGSCCWASAGPRSPSSCGARTRASAQHCPRPLPSEHARPCCGREVRGSAGDGAGQVAARSQARGRGRASERGGGGAPVWGWEPWRAHPLGLRHLQAGPHPRPGAARALRADLMPEAWHRGSRSCPRASGAPDWRRPCGVAPARRAAWRRPFPARRGMAQPQLWREGGRRGPGRGRCGGALELGRVRTLRRTGPLTSVSSPPGRSRRRCLCGTWADGAALVRRLRRHWPPLAGAKGAAGAGCAAGAAPRRTASAAE